MTPYRYHRSGADHWHPRQPQYDWQRQLAHGPIQPMHKQGWLARLFKCEGSR